MEIEWIDKDKKLSGYHILLRGEILKGDYEAFEQFYTRPITTQEELLTNSLLVSAPIHLESTGGDIEEALKIANLINALHLQTVVSGECASACTLLYLAGATRIVNSEGKIGLHRPYFQPDAYKKMPIDKAKVLYEEFEKVFKEKVLEYGLPQSLYETLIRTSSNQIYWLTPKEVNTIGVWPPYIEERIIAKCGAVPTSGVEDKNRFIACFKNDETEIRIDQWVAFRKSKGL